VAVQVARVADAAQVDVVVGQAEHTRDAALDEGGLSGASGAMQTDDERSAGPDHPLRYQAHDVALCGA
jgi:hypothetical protein